MKAFDRKLLRDLYGMRGQAMAIAFVASRRFVTSVLLGATTPAQLAETLAAATLRLDPAVGAEIEAIHTETPNPAPMVAEKSCVASPEMRNCRPKFTTKKTAWGMKIMTKKSQKYWRRSRKDRSRISPTPMGCTWNPA